MSERNPSSLTLWCNFAFPEPVMRGLAAEIGKHRLLIPPMMRSSNLMSSDADPQLREADIAIGQPDPKQVVELDRLKWIHVTSAGYNRYDTPEVREALRRRGGQLTNCSGVYEEPCAEHVLAMMLALARRLPQIVQDQATRAWRQPEHRRQQHLLAGQSALIYGYGAIAARLTELLRPFNMNVVGVRRQPRGDEPIRTVASADADVLLADTDHVIDILPSTPGSERFFDASRFIRIKPGAVFYNIGRGTTVDQPALIDALKSGHLSAAYLDVTDPEPLPPHHALWTTPNCHISPHAAGGHTTEMERLAQHFVENLKRYERGETLKNRVI